MNKLSMRARKLDNSKPLRIYRTEEIPDLEEQSQYGRSVLQIATGVEKEEEEEHHLQAVISASLVDAPNAKDISIPIPDATIKVPHYTSIYTQTFVVPKTLIRSTTDAEWNDDYDIDEEDTEWLQKQNKPTRKITEDQFESLFNQFEQFMAKDNSKELPESLEALGQVTSQLPPAVVADILNYWKTKREILKGTSLLHPLKPETVQNDPDPYVCFRRRELRPLRKGRRNDQQSLDKMIKLKHEMERARSIMDLVKKRDRLKKESLSLDFLIFEQKAKIWELRRIYQIPASGETDNQATELKKVPKFKPKIPPQQPQSKIRLNINGGVVRTISSDAASGGLDENIIRMPTTHINPTPNDEQELLDQRFLERQLAGIDPLQASLPDLDAPFVDPLTEFYRRRPITDYVDHSFTPGFRIQPSPSKRRSFQDFSETLGSRIPVQRGRARVGRGGRLIFDRSSRVYSQDLAFQRKRPFSEDSDEEEEYLDLDNEASKSVISVPLPFYTLNELSLLNGIVPVRRQQPPPMRRLDVSSGTSTPQHMGLGQHPHPQPHPQPHPHPPTTPQHLQSHPPHPQHPHSMVSPPFTPPFRPVTRA